MVLQVPRKSAQRRHQLVWLGWGENLTWKRSYELNHNSLKYFCSTLYRGKIDEPDHKTTQRSISGFTGLPQLNPSQEQESLHHVHHHWEWIGGRNVEANRIAPEGECRCAHVRMANRASRQRDSTAQASMTLEEQGWFPGCAAQAPCQNTFPVTWSPLVLKALQK